MAAKKDFVVKNGLVVGTTQDSATSGQFSWNVSEGTVDLSLQNGVTLQLGQEQHYYAKATEAISNGEVVMFAGAEGDHLLISKADVTVSGFIDEWVIGVATQDFATNDFGYVTSFGKVNELDTQTPGWSAGQLLYLDVSTPGALTTTRPTSPQPEILIAAVVRVNPAQGSIFVRPDYGMDLTNIHDVSLDSASLAHNQFLVYDSADSRWENQTVTTTIIGEGSNLYYTTARVDSDIDARVTKTFVDNLNVDADTLDNQDGTYYLDYTNFTNTPNVLDSADVLATVAADGYTKYDSANASGQINTAISNLIDGAPTALDTLNELAAALNDDANFAATVTNQIAALPDSAQVSAIITADVDKAFVDALNVDADTLDGQDGTYYLNYNNFTNTPNVLDSADVLATVAAGGYATQTYVNNAVAALPDSAQVSAIITADVDAAFINALTIDADTLNNQAGSYYLDYTNFTNTPNVLDSADVRNIFSASGDLTYNSTTGVFTFNETYSTANELLTAIKTVDGTTSGLDADVLDGQEGSYYLDYNNFTNTPAPGLDSAAVTIIAEDVALALSIALG